MIQELYIQLSILICLNILCYSHSMRMNIHHSIIVTLCIYPPKIALYQYPICFVFLTVFIQILNWVVFCFYFLCLAACLKSMLATESSPEPTSETPHGSPSQGDSQHDQATSCTFQCIHLAITCNMFLSPSICLDCAACCLQQLKAYFQCLTSLLV